MGPRFLIFLQVTITLSGCGADRLVSTRQQSPASSQAALRTEWDCANQGLMRTADNSCAAMTEPYLELIGSWGSAMDAQLAQYTFRGKTFVLRKLVRQQGVVFQVEYTRGLFERIDDEIVLYPDQSSCAKGSSGYIATGAHMRVHRQPGIMEFPQITLDEEVLHQLPIRATAEGYRLETGCLDADGSFHVRPLQVRSGL